MESRLPKRLFKSARVPAVIPPWLLVECLRNLGIASLRFVSGVTHHSAYAEAKAELNGSARALTQSDSTDLHAWAEAFLPGAGWIGLDPTSGLLAGRRTH